ncbi:MAG: metallophosphoesterase [Spirochaetaceae bacterium]|nr:MAG: metallophosphoesterase [Spirochaetaceae bacterium]
MNGPTASRERALERVYASSTELSIDDESRIVIFSDLHMGDGGWTDDFLHNGEMFCEVLARRYDNDDSTLILNGDVEELQRFSRRSIAERWGALYSLFRAFHQDGRLVRIVGNHDLANLGDMDQFGAEEPREGVILTYKGNRLFVLHGHQPLWKYERFNRWIGYVLKYLLNPLKIKNRTVAHNSRKRFVTEKRVYEFARSRGLLAIIGHTHRPLFESLSKVDVLRFEIERRCQEYPTARKARRLQIRTEIERLQQELLHTNRKGNTEAARRSLYNADFVVPCLFNSGCVLGKRGMTALEIRGGRIYLVHWFNALRNRHALRRHPSAQNLTGTSFYRVVLKEDSLDYVFSRIGLLRGFPMEPTADTRTHAVASGSEVA